MTTAPDGVESAMTLDDIELSPQKEIVRAFYKDMWDHAAVDLIPAIFHDGFTFRGSLGPVLVGYSAFADYVRWVTSSLEHYTSDILGMIEEGNQVSARLRGSQAGMSSLTSTASSFAGPARRVTPSSRRQRYTRLRSTSCRRATSVTVTPGSRVSERIRSLTSAGQFRRRSTPLSTSIRSTDTWLSSLQTTWHNATRQTQRFSSTSARRSSPDGYE